MWSVSPVRPLGRISTRLITLFTLVILVAVFMVVSAQTTYAQQATNTENGTLTHNEETYSTLTPIPKGDPTFKASVCGANTITAAYIHIIRDSDNSPAKGVRVICSKDITSDEFFSVTFPNAQVAQGSNRVSAYGTLTEQEGSDIDAIQRRYDFKGLPESTSSNTITDDKVRNANIPLPAVVKDERSYNALYEKFSSNIQSEGPTTLAPGSISTTNDSRSNTTSTCDSTYTGGLGWVICPVTNWLAQGMDTLYEILESFLIVSPVASNKSLVYMWGLVRGFANVLFIIGFLILIYSQITNIGLSNYGIKRLLPRLVIAVVLVNISFWVVALAVDLSNILGHELQEAFIRIRNNLPTPDNINLQPKDVNWRAVAGGALSGGMATLAVGGFIYGGAVTAGASIFLLLPALVGVIVSALVAILVLAARQAIITILVIISPLAFVAYLLPSTEKYFDKWKDLLTTMLVLFPAFAVIFGGAQLASMAIITTALENDKSPNFFNLIILGMIVQVAPVIITPLLVRLGGSLIGRIAGIVNDPNKGIIDRSRKFAEERADMHKKSQIGKTRDGKFVHNNPLALAARWNSNREIDKARKLKAYDTGIEAAYELSNRAHDTHQQSTVNEMLKSQGESEGRAAVARDIANQQALRRLYFQQHASKEAAEVADKENSTLFETLKTNPAQMAGSDSIARTIGEQAQANDERIRSLTSREAAAKNLQEKAYNEAITDSANTGLREFAGLNEIDPHGVARIVNISQESAANSYESLVGAGKRALEREEATLTEALEIIKNGTSSNAKFAHFADDLESRSAAIRYFMDKAPESMKLELVANTDMSSNAPRGTNAGVIRSEITGALKKNKPAFMSSSIINQMEEGTLSPNLNGFAGQNKMILDTLNKFGFDAEKMVSIDQDDVGAIAAFFKSPESQGLSPAARNQIRDALEQAFNQRDRYAGRMGKNRNNLNLIRRELNLPVIEDEPQDAA